MSENPTAPEGEDGLTIALSPVQLAAVLVEETITPAQTTLNRIWGGARLLGGVVELAGAGVLCAAPDPTLVTKAGCVFVGAHGADTFVAGWRQLASGRPEQSLTERGATSVARTLGASESAASTIGVSVDIAVSLAGAAMAGAVRVASVRAGRIQLLLHEAPVGSRVGGHTIARHVGQTLAAMRARLAGNPRLATVSTFTNLEIAETAISRALRANAATINQWARTAAVGDKLALEFRYGSVVGQGVSRASAVAEDLSSLRVVLKMERFNGMTHYILTAFPIR